MFKLVFSFLCDKDTQFFKKYNSQTQLFLSNSYISYSRLEVRFFHELGLDDLYLRLRFFNR
jgi:hypothetical protein